MIMKKLSLTTMFTVFTMLSLSCSSPSPSAELPIGHDKAVIIAATNVPYKAIKNASEYSILNNNTWTVSFVLPDKATVSRTEIGWLEGPNTSFINQGFLPPDTYRLLTFKINGSTGDIISREASDSILLGGPGVFYTRPQPFTEQWWFPVLTAATGMITGGLIAWLFFHRKVKQIKHH